MVFVSSCEGGVRSIFVHWAPTDPDDYLDGFAWQTEPLPAAQNKAKWMFALPMQVDGVNGIDLIAGAKDRIKVEILIDLEPEPEAESPGSDSAESLLDQSS